MLPMGAGSSLQQEQEEWPEPDSLTLFGLQAFVLERKIGQGSFGVVWKAQRKVDKETVAIKIQDKDKAKYEKQALEDKERYEREKQEYERRKGSA